MNIRRKPKSIAALFVGGTTLLVGGAAVAATLSPSTARMVHMANTNPSSTGTASIGTAPAGTARAGTATPKPTVAPKSSKSRVTATTPTSPAAPKSKSRPGAQAPITYTVRRGDTLSGIAAWFKLHGYGNLYAANAKVIGANPNLIHPGERITIGTHVMKVQGPA